MAHSLEAATHWNTAVGDTRGAFRGQKRQGDPWPADEGEVNGNTTVEDKARMGGHEAPPCAPEHTRMHGGMVAGQNGHRNVQPHVGVQRGKGTYSGEGVQTRGHPSRRDRDSAENEATRQPRATLLPHCMLNDGPPRKTWIPVSETAAEGTLHRKNGGCPSPLSAGVDCKGSGGLDEDRLAGAIPREPGRTAERVTAACCLGVWCGPAGSAT